MINILFFIPAIIFLILWLCVSIKVGVLFYGLYSIGMYIHITITTLTNAFVGRELNSHGDLFWKMAFLIIGCLCLTLFFIKI